MTDDYLAISNTGKNITITMTPGMKQRILGTHGRIRLRLGVDNRLRAVVLVPCGPGHGYQMIRRKNVWNMSVSSKRLPGWPKHERVVLDASQVDMTEHGAFITLPKPALDIDSMLRSLPAHIRRDMPLPPPTRVDHPAMNRPVPADDFERKLRAELLRAARESAPTRHLFNVPDMVVAAITGGAIGAVFTLIMAALGWVK